MKKYKNIVFSFVRVSDNSMVASVRIARYVAAYLQSPIVDQTNIGEWTAPGTKLDALVIINGAYGFCKCLPELAMLVGKARRIIWVQNDYSIVPPKTDSAGVSPFRAAFRERHQAGLPDMDFWSTCSEWALRKGSSYVNWNMLTFDTSYDPRVVASRRKKATDTLLYYGSYRDGSGKSSRVPLFDRYFKSPVANTVISSPVDRFALRYPECEHVGAIRENFYEDLGTHGLGLYIEDRKSSENFHSPANRFYEMLSAGLPMVFQPECGGMLRQAGFDPSPYVVEKARDIQRMMKNREDIGREQREKWISDYHGRLMSQMMIAYVQLEIEL